MSDWTCEQVEGCIDLYAAGEADGATRAAVGRHLKACPSCTESHRQAQRLLGLLDQRFQEQARVQRLWARLEAEPKRARRPPLWRAAALAASVLATLGLSGWLGPGRPNAAAGPQVAVAPEPSDVGFAPGPAAFAVRSHFPKAMDANAPAAKEAAPLTYPLDLGGKTPAAIRREAPPPPAVHLALEVRNPGREVLPLRFDDGRTRLVLALEGPGVLDVPAPGVGPPLAALGLVRLAPGETISVPIPRLAYGSPGAVHYLYWTEPGEYVLTVTLRARVETDPLAGTREIVQTSGPIKIRVRGER